MLLPINPPELVEPLTEPVAWLLLVVALEPGELAMLPPTKPPTLCE